ncbi:MAG TPA: UdgX family uracil-DNA binding protein [Terriglobales bacterium]
MRIRIEPSFESWAQAAAVLLHEGVRPERIEWNDGSRIQPVLFGEPERVVRTPHAMKRGTEFTKIGEMAACHTDPQRWPLLYRVVYRMRTEPDLLRVEVDDDVRELRRMQQQVKKDLHKMHAFVRYRKVEYDGTEHYIAWYRPDHYIEELAASFFIERFSTMRWSILTPHRSLHWDGSALQYGPGVQREQAPAADELESLWRTYFGAVNNPARMNLNKMRSEMPTRFWSELPELVTLPALLEQAPDKIDTMLRAQEVAWSATPFVPETRELLGLRNAAANCRGCPLYQQATCTVFGEGPQHARIVLIGEQPGDSEDRSGRPFVGPAGEVLMRALREAGVERDDIYVTNAVKHFAHTPRGKQRIHRTPRLSEVVACRPWLDAEIAAIQPRLLVCAGATAAASAIRPHFSVTKGRGRIEQSRWGVPAIVTFHPSAVLRAEAASESIYRDLVSDLCMARVFVEKAEHVTSS